MQIDLAKLEPFCLIAPGPLAQLQLDRHPKSKRFMNLGLLQKGVVGECAWCNVALVPGIRNKYCGENCRESAYMYCNPQSASSRAWIFINRQACTCLSCGEIHEDEWADKIERKYRHLTEMQAKGWYKHTQLVPYHWLGSGMGEKLHLDHTVPLHQGGQGIGFANVRVLCIACHGKKTYLETQQRAGK